MMIVSSTVSFLPEKSSSAFDLMSWIGRGNVLTITVDMALLSEGVSADARGYVGTYVHLGRKAATIWAS
jgi:hypothetical protein